MQRFISTVCLGSLLTVLALPSAASAQSRRMMLVEEATNASCPPCAAQNPYFEAYLALPYNQEDIIPICFHANFPGKDVMNAANGSMHNGRVNFYGISGVPTAVVNGKIPTRIDGGYDGSPADTAAIFAAMKPVRGTMSPITLNIKQSMQGDSLSATVHVSSTDAISASTLRIVVVEREHYYTAAGTNGEKTFVYIARAMGPTSTGAALTLDAGGSADFSMKVPIDSTWNRDETYVVAFVQKNSTKEVLQAGTSKINLAVTADAPSTVRVKGSSAAEQDWNLDVMPSDSTSMSISILSTKLPAGWKADVRYGETAIDSGKALTVNSTLHLGQLQVGIVPGSVGGVGRVTIRITGERGATTDRTYKLYSGDFDVLVLSRDEGNTAILTKYDEAMSKGSVSYVIVDREDESLFDMKEHRAVVCEVGKAVLDSGSVAMLADYIQSGGRLFLAGAEIGWGLADPTASGTYQNFDFLANDLHATYLVDDAGTTSVAGVTGDPVGDGLGTFSIGNGVQNQDTPDEIEAGPGAIPILHYSNASGPVAGIRYADANHRLIYLAFGVEGIGDATKRGNLMKQGITWLLGSDRTVSVDRESTPLSGTVGDLRPNPSTGRFAVPVTLEHTSHVSVAVYDQIGRLLQTVQEGTLQAGSRVISGDASGLSSGSYSVVVDVDGVRRAMPLVIIR
jgi:hypothetical protein